MKVLIASDHALVGQSLLTSLRGMSPGAAITARLCVLAALTETVRVDAPDVVLVDATTNTASARHVVRALLEELPDTPVVLLGTARDDGSIYEAILDGAAGYVPVEASLEMLGSTLRGVMRGELGLSRADARRVVHHLRRASRADAVSQGGDIGSRLTPREQQVFDLMRRGLRSREIAEKLGIAEATVYKHIQNILEKLRVHSRAQAIFLSSAGDDSRPSADAIG